MLLGAFLVIGPFFESLGEGVSLIGFSDLSGSIFSDKSRWSCLDKGLEVGVDGLEAETLAEDLHNIYVV